MTREDAIDKALDELQNDFLNVNLPLMEKMTLFAKVQNAVRYVADLPSVEPQGKYDELMEQYKHLRKYASDLETKLSVEPQEWEVYEVLHGEWEGTKKYRCKCCGYKVGVFNTNFCPECGVKMSNGRSWKHGISDNT